MKILVLNPPFLPRYSRASRSPAVTRSGTLYYPMWLAYAVGHLEQCGHTILFLDAPANDYSPAEIARRAAEFGAELAVLDTSTPSIQNDCTVGEFLQAQIPGLFVVLVGVHVSALPQETLLSCKTIQAVAFGEYDHTVADLAALLLKPDGLSRLGEVAGLCFRSTNNTIIQNRARELITDLDSLPMVSSVYRRHLNIQHYFYGHSKFPLMVLVSGRGCPFKCTYCVLPQTMMGHAYRKRSIAGVVAEFQYIAANFPDVKEIMFEDDTFTADKNRCREFAQALIAAKATTIPWSANSRADVDYETMRLLRKANCRLFCVGFESGDQTILDAICKSITLDKIQQFRRDARKAGILIHGCFMVGNRGETPATLEKTLKHALALNPDTAQFYPIMVYPGTSDYRYFGEKGWITTTDFRQWLTPEGLHSSVVSNPALPYEVLVEFCDRARRTFFLRPAYIIQKMFQMVRHPSEARRLIKAALPFLWYQFKKPARKDSATACRTC